MAGPWARRLPGRALGRASAFFAFPLGSPPAPSPRRRIGGALHGGRHGEGGGLLLGSIEQDPPAAKAGLLLGDVIVAIDGKRLESFDQLLDVLSDDSVGRKVSLDVVRAGTQRKVE